MATPQPIKAAADQLQMIDIDKVSWPERYRKDLGDMEDLTESVRDKGVLQPITVTKIESGFRLLAGERRFTAAEAAGLKKIPALIRKIDGEVDAREIELIENIYRKDFEWHERARLIQEIDRLYKEKNIDWSGRKTAELLDKSVASVARDLKLATALEAAPELSEMKTADEALKTIAKLEESTIVEELRGRQRVHMLSDDEPESKMPGFIKGLKQMLKIADANYTVGDTFVEMAALRTEGVIHVIECDPPYGIDLAEQKRSKESVTSNVHTYTEVDRDKYPAFLDKLARELYRVAGRHCWLIFWFGPSWQHEVLSALRSADWQVDEIPGIWVKNQGQTQQPELYLGRAYEPFFLCRKGNPVLVKRGRLNVFQYTGVHGAAKIHPTERPVALIQELLETVGIPRQICFVPFLGSGNTLRAAYKVGMSAFGYDISGEYRDKFMLAVEEDTRDLFAEDA